MSQDAMRIPPPTFEFLVLSVKMQAEMQMGLMNFGQEPEGGPDLAGARHAIDLLAMLAEKTRGNLTIEEQRLVENSLTELRFRFVQVSQESAAKSAATKEAPTERVTVDFSSEESSSESAAANETTSAEAGEPVEATFTVEASSGAARGEKSGKKREEKDEESSVSSSGVKVTDRRAGAKATE